MSEGYDDDNEATEKNPLETKYGDYTIPTALYEYTDEEAKSANTFTLPEGKYDVICLGIPTDDKDAFKDVMEKVEFPDGSPGVYRAKKVKVKFQVLGLKPKADGTPNLFSLQDTFIFPPADAKEHRAYFEGVPEGRSASGWAASKFRHFLGRLGFDFPKSSAPPAEANATGNWYRVGMTVEVQHSKPYKGNDGLTKPGGFPQIKAFSYERMTMERARELKVNYIANNRLFRPNDTPPSHSPAPVAAEAAPKAAKKIKNVSI
jgi:hypothetical protein